MRARLRQELRSIWGPLALLTALCAKRRGSGPELRMPLTNTSRARVFLCALQQPHAGSPATLGEAGASARAQRVRGASKSGHPPVHGEGVVHDAEPPAGGVDVRHKLLLVEPVAAVARVVPGQPQPVADDPRLAPAWGVSAPTGGAHSELFWAGARWTSVCRPRLGPPLSLTWLGRARRSRRWPASSAGSPSCCAPPRTCRAQTGTQCPCGRQTPASPAHELEDVWW